MPETKIIYGDGNRYEFTPGENGKLIVRKKKKGFDFDFNMPPSENRAKTIGPKDDEPKYAMKMVNGKMIYTR